MKHFIFSLLTFSFLACASWKNVPTQSAIKSEKQSISDNKTNGTQIKDPLNVHEYELANGLKVFISPNAAEPRIQTLVLVKAGSIHDPADATGLAHYLEHMLFKGNDQLGTINYEDEKVEIDKIKNLFEELKSTADTSSRKKIYHQIDSISGVAAKYACPNEIDQLFTQIGAKGTNAYTSKEFTGYINDIPANQLENWLKIEQQRYTNPVLRLFHTELEAVYEEKNITLDKADRRMYELFFEAIFPNHNYGQQTTIGTVEHLKSPSMFAIEKYFSTHYVPNNMAVFLAGDVNPDSAFALVKKHFEKFVPKEVPPYIFDNSHRFSAPVEKKMSSKEAPHLMLGYRFAGAGKKESLLVEMIDMLLANSTAGLIDLNVNQQQKAIGAYSYPYSLKDYTLHILGGQPNEGQSLEDLQKILQDQLLLIKKGEFPDWMLEAVVNDLKKRELSNNRSNRHRVSVLSDAFAKNIPWKEQINHFEELSAITKEEIMDFAEKSYGDNYVVLYRSQSEEEQNLQVEKPEITPIEVPEGNRSKFLVDFSKNNRPETIAPVFVQYEKEISVKNISETQGIYIQKNTQDSLFSLSFEIPFGSKDDSLLSMAFEYIQLCGTSQYALSELNQKWYQLGVDYGLSAGEDKSYINFSGLSKNMPQALALFAEIVQDIQLDSMQLILLKNKVVQLRKNSLTDKRHLLWTGLKNYLVYGKNSPANNSLNNQAILELKKESLLSSFQYALSQVNNIYYYGPEMNLDDALLQNLIPSDVITKTYVRKDNPTENEIYVLDFDMQQAEILMMSKRNVFSKEELPVVTLFNEYFGGGMSSIVFQEIREKKALAYSVYAGYTSVKDSADPHYALAYIGTQADKYEESLDAMMQLFDALPYDSLKFEQAKAAIKQKYASNRIVEHAMIGAYQTDKALGYSYDKRKDIYEKIDQISFQELSNFFEKNFKGQTFKIAILGNLKILDQKKLESIGKVKVLSKEELFPY